MISIQKLLYAKPKPDPAALMRIASLLLEAIAVHAVDCDPIERNEFQLAIRKYRRLVDEKGGSGDILVSTGAAIQTLENYNRGIERFIRIRGKELQEMVGMFKTSLIEISHAGESAVQNLNGIEKDLHRTSQIEDLRELKGKLADSLKRLGEETNRQQEQTEKLAAVLEQKISDAECTLQGIPVELDPVTGLPGGGAAVRALTARVAAGKTSFAAIFCVERLDLINSRFGTPAGEEILRVFSQFVKEQLTAADKLFRWKGAALVAILARPGSFNEVQLELRRNAAKRLEHTVSIGSRLVLLPITQSWSLLPVSSGTTVEDVCAKIDSFVTSQRGKGPMQ